MMPGRLVSDGQATPGPQVASSPTGRPVPARRTFQDFHATPGTMTMDVPSLPGLPSTDHTMASAVGQESTFMSGPTGPRSTDRRYSFLPSPLMTNRKDIVQSGPQFQRQTAAVRPQSAMGLMTPNGFSGSGKGTTSGGHQYQGHQGHNLYDRSPSAMGTSWTSRGHGEGKPAPMRVADGPSLESRLQALMTDNPTDERREALTASPSHHRSYSLSDGHALPPRNRIANESPTVGSTDDVYAVVARRPEPGARDRQGQGYPSSPGYNRRQTSQRPMTGTGRDNPAFSPDGQSPLRSEASSRVGQSSLDMRNAWQRLYGSNSETNPVHRAPHEPRPVSRQGVRVQDGQRPMSPYANYDRLNKVSTPVRRPGSAMNSKDESHSVDISTNAVNFHSTSSRASPSVELNSRASEDENVLSNHGPNSYNRYGRQSPTGQSSSQQDPVSGSHNSSGLSSQSGNIHANIETVKPNVFHHGNISPASKYPEMDFGSTTRPPQYDLYPTNQGRQTPKLPSSSPKHQARSSNLPDTAKRTENLKYLRNNPSFQVSFSGSEDESDTNYPIDGMDSIFDYNFNDLPSETESSTAQAAAKISPVDSPKTKEVIDVHGSRSPKVSSEHLRTKSPAHVISSNPRSYQQNMDNWSNEKSDPEHSPGFDAKNTKIEPAHVRQHLLTNYARSRSLEDVRESGGDSDLSFDVENTFLTVDPSDQSEMGTLKSKSSSMRAQLDRLEGMYKKVMNTMDEKDHTSARTTRRWSLGSSDASSLRHEHRQRKAGRSSQGTHGSQRMSSKDVRSIGKRFQRLESHVITLARSVAHLSSELRSQNTMSREIENVKKEMQELKNQSHIRPSGHGRSELDKYRGWIPPLTNPRRVNKLTKFFGQEPPLLEIFLKRLGYDRYVKNFEQEHIGMMELPYMTEERLQSIGIPMGPRLRILQESQMCFTHDNFNIYIV